LVTASLSAARSPKAQRAFELVALLPDPEIPVVNLLDLGILRDVVEDDAGALNVTLTPTYSGCPATEAIASDVRTALSLAGLPDARVNIVLSPAWSSDWISEAGRDKLRAYGIAPPNCSAREAQQVIAVRRKNTVACPRCQSMATEQLSNFGSTPCKAMYRCTACREPFDYFKPY
jgi:ring-1,2-phenylacetyl-CoA epoxidase subunit PaaD